MADVPAPKLLWQRRSRASLMRGTALQAAALAVLATPAAAQIAVNARPVGGQVSAGQASISDTASKTLINQSSQNAAINWQSYNVGSGQTVQYVQPNAASVTLNRVVGANPSTIAGHILANGQIVLVNQSGVVFSKGAQVDTAGLVVTTAGITDTNFMAGKLVFDQAGHPGSSISNAGNITIRQAGLAALVAPQVANSGTITARLGRVILGGAETHTLDLYGDGLVALNVTGQVTKASLAGHQVTALVTNSGTILAPGGTVVLSASAADGVVTNLVEAGGKVAADSVGAQTGRVLVQGIGGGISIDGDVSASGMASGTKGGQVVANATGNVHVGAAGVVDASGQSGGGVIALGTTAARAIGGASVTPTLVAQTVTLAAGSHVSANAKRRGNGGRIALLSRNATTQTGNISARGGAGGGNGGWIEVSGGQVTFGGPIDAGASLGKAGSIVIDPANLQIAGTDPDNRTTTYVSAAQFGLLAGNVILKADGQLSVAGAATDLLATSLQLEGDAGIAINAALNVPNAALGLQTNGAITEGANGVITAASLSADAGGAISLFGANRIADISVFDNTGGSLYAGTVTTLNSDGFATTRAPTSRDAINLSGIIGGAALTIDNAASLTIDSGAFVGSTDGDVTIAVSGTNGTGNASAPNQLIVAGNISANDVALSTTGTVSRTGTGAPYAGTAISLLGGSVSAAGSNAGSTVIAGTVTLSAAMGGISIGGPITTTVQSLTSESDDIGGATTLTALAGDIIEQTGANNRLGSGSILTGTLSGAANPNGSGTGAPAGDANFAITAGNTITTLTGFSSTGNFALEDDSQLVVKNLQSDGIISIGGPTSSAGSLSGILVLTGAISASGNIDFSNALGIAELGSAAITSINGSVGMVTGGAIVQQTGATITGAEASSVGRGIALMANGSTDFDTYLQTPTLGFVSGMSLSGTVTAGKLVNGAYDGAAQLSAADGDILQPAGSLRVGTLTGSANGSGEGPDGDVLLSVSSGNSISLVTSFSATGSLVLESDVALTLGKLSAGPTISVSGPTDAAASTGVLTVGGPVSATDGGISLANAQGIGVLGAASIDSGTAGVVISSSNGAIAVQDGATVTGAEDSATGMAISLNAGGSTVFPAVFGTVHGISIDGVLTAGTSIAGSSSIGSSAGPYTGAMSLVAAAGDITEGDGGQLLTGTLSGNAAQGPAGTGNAFLSAGPGNIVGTLNAFSTTGIFTLEDDAGLIVQDLAGAGGIGITGAAQPGGFLLLTGTITAGGTARFSNALGVAELAAASVTDASGGITLASAGGAVVQQAGASLSGGTVTLVSGGSSTFDRNTGFGTVAGVAFDGTVTGGTFGGGAYSGSATFSATHGDILEGDTATLHAGTVSAQASGALTIDVASGNIIGGISGFAQGGDVVIEDDSGLSLGNMSASGSLSLLEPAAGVAQTGVLIVTGTVTAADGITLANRLGIGELSQAVITSTTSTVSLSTAGAISQQAASTIEAATAPGQGTATGTLLTLSAGGSTAFDTYVPADNLGTVHGIAFSGTLTAGTLAGGQYSGLVDLVASAGNIVEGGTGNVRADMLEGGATAGGGAAGDALFLAASGNVVGTLDHFPVSGSFALEDDSGLVVLGQSAGGSIDIHSATDGTAPSGILILEGAITAPGNITLGNALGVADLAGTRIASTSGGVTLSSTGGAVLEQAGATITSGATTGADAAIALLAGGTTDFTSPPLAASLGTINGVEIDGSVVAGSLIAGAYTGSAEFSVTHGNIVESATATVQVGSLTLLAAGTGAGNVSLEQSSGNDIAAIGHSSVTGSLSVEDDTGLTLGAIAGGTSIFVHGPTDGTPPAGILSVDGAVSAAGSITLSNALGIADLADGSVTSTGAAVTLTSSGGAILQQAGGTIAGGTASGTGTLLSLVAGGSTDFAAYGVTAPLTPVSGIAFSGTLAAGQLAGGVYSGIANFAAGDGNIIEGATGSVRTAMLVGSATGSGSVAGDALFDASAGNVVSTLSAFTVTGNFALEDDAGLRVLGQTSGGSVDIHGPTDGSAQTGILVIDGTITALGAITLDNALGIAELSFADVASTGAGVVITSQNGAILQQTLSSMSAAGTLLLSAGGSTDFTTLLPGSGLGTTGGIAFSGTIAGAGAVLLSASAGDITEAAAGALDAGTLAAAASGNLGLTGSANRIANIGPLGSVQPSLTLSGLFAGGSIGIALNDAVSLNILGDAGHAVIQATSTGATLSIDETGAAQSGSATTYGSLTLGNFGTSTLLADGSITLDSTGRIAQGAGLVQTARGALSLNSGGGDITQNGGTFSALLGDVTLSTTGSIMQSAATIGAGGNATLAADGGITMDASHITAVGDAVLSSTTGRFIQNLSSLSGTQGVALNFGGDIGSVQSTITSAGTVAIAAGGSMILASTVTAGTALLSAQGDLTQSSSGSAFTGMIVAPALAAAAGGNLVLSGGNQVQSIIGAAPLNGLSADSGSIAFNDTENLTLAAGASLTALKGSIVLDLSGSALPNLLSDGAIVQAGGDITLAVGGTLTQTGGFIRSTGGGVTLSALSVDQGGDGAVLADTTLSVTASSGGIVQSAGSTLAGGQAVNLQSNGDASLSGTLQAGLAAGGIYGGALGIGSGGNILAGGATILAGTLAALSAGAIDLSGAGNEIARIGIAGALSGLQGSSITLQDAQSLVLAAPVTATGDIDLTAAGVVEQSTVNVTGDTVNLSATGGPITIDGTLSAGGALSLVAATDISEGQSALIIGNGIGLDAITGTVGVAGTIISRGGFALSAGTDVTEAAGGIISGDLPNTGTAPGVTDAPLLTVASGGSVTAGGNIGLGGMLSDPVSLTLSAGNAFTLGASGRIDGGPVSVTARTGSATIDGAFTSDGAFTIDAGTDITQGAGSTIADTSFATQGLSSLLAAPGTITLGGTLSAASLLIGEQVTKPSDPETTSIVWNNTVVQTGSNAAILGATSSISIPAPLTPGHGALGVYLETQSFQQTGVSTVTAMPGNGSAATIQLAIEGRGVARFADLLAPGAQLLLVLEQGGTAGGTIDVAGLNIYYTTGIIPVSPVVLQGVVGGREGFAAAAVGFSHHLPNVDYQINGCPIESINCILLSPLLVPIVDPVNDYAEGTQRKRHQDDDALPNVGEEDY